MATAYLHRSAATVARVAEVLGLPEDQWRPYRAIAEGALEAWRREFIREDGTLAVATQASHVRALAFGLVPAELRAAVAGRLAELIDRGRRPPRDRLPVHGLPAARPGRHRAPGPGV